MAVDPRHPSTAAGAILIVIVSVCVTAFVAWTGAYERYDNDTAQAVIGARFISAGDGYLTDGLYYQEHYRPQTIPAPQTVFPPGSSMMIAGLTKLSLTPPQALSVIAFVALGLVPICVFLLALKAGVRASLAVVVALLWIGVASAWENAYRLRGDVPFLMLTVISTWFLARPVRRPVAFALIGGCFAAMALLVRYAGLFYMTAAALCIVFDWWRRKTRTEFLELVAFCIPTGITVLLLFVRNYQAVGDVKGGNSFVANKPTVQSIREFYEMWVSLTGFGHTNLFNWNPVEYVMIAAAVLGVILLIIHRRSIRLDRTVIQVLVDGRVATICIVYPVLAIAMLVWLEFNSSCGMRARMFMVFIPYLMIIGVFVPQVAKTQSGGKSFRLVGMLLIVGFLLGQVEAGKTALVELPSLNTIKAACESPVDETNLGDFLREKISAEHPLVVNEPQIVAAYLERPVVGLADWRYTDIVWDSEAVRQHAKTHDVQWLLVFTDESLGSDWVPFLAELAAGQTASWLKLKSANKQHRLYRVVD
ncbi:glycosyltransferase family 39 protein [bacterium]|nr:glycosyltransferase family 39 protein [bacterium]